VITAEVGTSTSPTHDEESNRLIAATACPSANGLVARNSDSAQR